MKKSQIVSVFVVTALPLLLGACASVNSVSLTPIPVQRNNVVRAQVEKTVILGFNFDNDFINPLVEDLKRKCPGGVVSGILTKDETISYVLVYNHRVSATGFCSRGTTAQNRSSRGAASDLEAGETPAPGMSAE